MTNKIIISIGAVILIVLTALYLGNKVVSTTPKTTAVANPQYKVIPAYDTNDLQGSNKDSTQLYEDQLTKYAVDGWKLAGIVDSQSGAVAFVLEK